MSGWNGKVRCVDTDEIPFYTEGKVYEVVDGRLTDDYSRSFEGIKDIIDLNIKSNATWEEVKENDMEEFTLDDIKSGYLVEIRDGRLLLAIEISDGMELYETFNYPVCTVKGQEKGSRYEIMKVYGFSKTNMLLTKDTRELLWSRKETTVEVEVDGEWKELNITVKDEKGNSITLDKECVNDLLKKIMDAKDKYITEKSLEAFSKDCGEVKIDTKGNGTVAIGGKVVASGDGTLDVFRKGPFIPQPQVYQYLTSDIKTDKKFWEDVATSTISILDGLNAGNGIGDTEALKKYGIDVSKQEK